MGGIGVLVRTAKWLQIGLNRRNCGKIMMKVSTGTSPWTVDGKWTHEVKRIPIDNQTGASRGLTTVIR